MKQRQRVQKRDGVEVRVWMLRNKVTGAAVARHAECSLPYVFQTVDGIRNSRRVLGSLLALGCPPELLALPEDMQTTELAQRAG